MFRRFVISLFCSFAYLATGAVHPDTILTEGLTTAIPVEVSVQGKVRSWPEEDLNRRLTFLKQTLSYVSAYSKTVPGDHLFHWEGNRTNLSRKRLHLYFTDLDYVTFDGSLDVGHRFVLQPNSRQEELTIENRANGDWNLVVIIKLNKILNLPDAGGVTHPYGEIYLKSLLTGRLLGSVTSFLNRDLRLMNSTTLEQNRIWGHESRRFAVTSEAAFLEWWMKQPEHELDSAEEQRFVRDLADWTFRRKTEVRPSGPTSPPDASGCGPAVTGNSEG